MQDNHPDRSVLQQKQLFIFDMDGTVYLGSRVFPFAIRFIKNLRAHGKRILFFTNNASHSPAFYLEKLTRLGFEPTREEIMTSGDVTIEFLLRHRAGKQVYLEIVHDLAIQNGIGLSTEDLDRQAEAFAIGRGGRSPRAAKQFIDFLLSEGN